MPEGEPIEASSPLPSPIPKLDAPGAGLPFFEMLLQKTIIFPMLCKITTFDSAIRIFEKESKLLLREVALIPAPLRDKRILVPRLPAIEDSSRFWSAAMVLEHLIIVGGSIKIVAQHLVRGETPPGVADIAAVKPPGDLAGSDCLDQYKIFSDDFLKTIRSMRGDQWATATFNHPWFGPLTVHKWICLAAIHQRIHRRQIEAIIRLL